MVAGRSGFVCGQTHTAPTMANIAEISVIVTGFVALGVPLVNECQWERSGEARRSVSNGSTSCGQCWMTPP